VAKSFPLGKELIRGHVKTAGDGFDYSVAVYTAQNANEKEQPPQQRKARVLGWRLADGKAVQRK